jgi:hypothetical protein
MNWEAFNTKCQSMQSGNRVYRVPAQIIEFCKFPIVKRYAHPIIAMLHVPRPIDIETVPDRLDWLAFIDGGVLFRLYLNCNIHSRHYGSMLLRNIGHTWIVYSNVDEFMADVMEWINFTCDPPSIDTNKYRESGRLNFKFGDGGSFADALLSKYDKHNGINPIRNTVNKVIAESLMYSVREYRNFPYWVYLKYVKN